MVTLPNNILARKAFYCAVAYVLNLYILTKAGAINNCRDTKNLTNENKRWLLMHSFRPASNYKFPSKMEYGKGRSFQHAWLQEFPWLSYSESFNGGFCINCVLFSKNKCVAGQLVKNPMINLTSAKQILEVHASQQLHLASMKDTSAFLEMIDNIHLSVQQHLETQAVLKVKHNRDVLRSILRIIILCGKQNIALRGHQEISLCTEESTPDTNSGNFLALLTLLSHSGDVILQEHIKSSPKNAQ